MRSRPSKRESWTHEARQGHKLTSSKVCFQNDAMPVYDYDLKEILPRLQGPLRELLDAETAAGNTITEVSASWPMKNSICSCTLRAKASGQSPGSL